MTSGPECSPLTLPSIPLSSPISLRLSLPTVQSKLRFPNRLPAYQRGITQGKFMKVGDRIRPGGLKIIKNISKSCNLSRIQFPSLDFFCCFSKSFPPKLALLSPAHVEETQLILFFCCYRSDLPFAPVLAYYSRFLLQPKREPVRRPIVEARGLIGCGI